MFVPVPPTVSSPNVALSAFSMPTVPRSVEDPPVDANATLPFSAAISPESVRPMFAPLTESVVHMPLPSAKVTLAPAATFRSEKLLLPSAGVPLVRLTSMRVLPPVTRSSPLAATPSPKLTVPPSSTRSASSRNLSVVPEANETVPAPAL